MSKDEEELSVDKWANIRRLKESGLVAVIRKANEDHVYRIAESLIEGGVGVLEITVDTHGAFDIIRNMKEKYQQRILIGAGTVLDASTARTAMEVGADFIFSPILDLETIQVTNFYGRISIPGVMTPTEIVKGYQAGADLLKIFPGRSLGANYIKELQGPLGHIPMIPTGGVTLENVSQFIQNGAVAVGVGGSLVNKKAVEQGDYNKLTELARKFTTQISEARNKEVANENY